jgi:hypothetical protein
MELLDGYNVKAKAGHLLAQIHGQMKNEKKIGDQNDIYRVIKKSLCSTKKTILFLFHECTYNQSIQMVLVIL